MKKLDKKLIALLSLLFVLILIGIFWSHNNSSRDYSKIFLEVRGNHKIGDAVNIDININTGRSTINAAEVYLKFDPKFLKIKSIETQDSIFQIWMENEPKFSNANGTISLAGGLPTPGFNGKGKLGIIKAELIQSGKTEISFTDKSRMLLNDGEGTTAPLQIEQPIELTISR